jgi:hypothetical protein
VLVIQNEAFVTVLLSLCMPWMRPYGEAEVDTRCGATGKAAVLSSVMFSLHLHLTHVLKYCIWIVFAICVSCNPYTSCFESLSCRWTTPARCLA